MKNGAYDQSIRERAIFLRKNGYTYSEILQRIPIVKSTLSLWLKNVGLSKSQNQRLTKKKLEAAKRGGLARRNQRIELTKRIHQEAQKDIGKITQRELWLIGVMLYWAEGSKEKEYRPGSGANFTNSDPRMIKIFLKWLTEICMIGKDRIFLDIYIHIDRRSKLEKVIEYWAETTGFPKDHFTRIYFKKGNRNTKRKNIGKVYFGVLRINVRASSSLNRKIAGWTEGVVKYLS